MKLPMNLRCLRPIAVACLCGVAPSAFAQITTAVPYRLLPGSTLLSEFCLEPCLCPYRATETRLVGTFDLRLRQQGPLFTIYDVERVKWQSVSPTGETEAIVGRGEYQIGGEVALMNELNLDLTIGLLTVITPFESGRVVVGARFPQIDIVTQSKIIGCRRWTIHMIAEPDLASACYADCNADGDLDIRDFICFQNKFALGEKEADCTADGVLDIRDFTCFQNRFAAGCP